jgi:signal transduction histidine kinase/CheY-like chemotaxis protein
MSDPNGNVVGIVGIGRDITKFKEVQDALRRREHFLADIFASIQDGISVLDTDMNIVQVNPAIEQWNPDFVPLVGKKCYAAYHNRTTPCETCPTKTAIATAKGAFEAIPLKGPDGEIIKWLDVHSFPLFDQDTGKITGVIEYIRDITEQKSLENQLRHAQKLESLGVLAGGIAHDFNNLLVGMQGYAGLALMKLSTDSPARSYVEKIEAGARRAAELTNQMLAYSGKGAFVKQPLDVSKLVEDVGRLVAASISKKAVMRYHCTKGLPLVVGDPTQLHQVVMNLIINASDSLGDQQGSITLNTGVVRVDQEYLANTYINDALPDGEYISLEVSDTGCGMSRETLTRIFDPFFSTKFAGRGLGLAAVLGIVRGHKGAIKVYSEVGHGTTFKILLPARNVSADVAEPQPQKRKSLDGYKGNGLILVADDEETVRNVTKEVLTTFGFSVVLAENGRQAVEMFKEHQSSLSAVLLDLTMPIMSGLEVFNEIQKISPDVPVMLSSGYTEQDVSERFTGARPAGFIQKPYVHTELMSKLRGIIKPETVA